ncbi:O-glycosyl hydrolase [Pedobacter cryoconitis]|uniref:O-glycosyl hydrolase n=1 Tax=Pedobacter cryoconitis TaxID=188932 RepID=A0A7W9DIW1_9SPHI|nr:glycoside hydrolase [Pedobacter cryoconitis]MBB5620558.1 O-glycosyl hydrolase [Pedobacter cryoconitis]
MKKSNLIMILPVLLALSCKKENVLEQQKLSSAKNDAVEIAKDTASITLSWNKTYQKIEGFGAFGGRITPFFESPKRDSIMNYLWGQTGLQLTIIRGKIIRSYPFDKQTGVVSIKPAGADIDMDINSAAYKKLTEDEKEQIGQLWILKNAKERYQLPIMFASAWTPPLYMKTNPGSESAKNFNGLDFKCCSTDFARYLSGFTKAYQNEGINFYAISPTNEPENIFSDWDASYWDSKHLGEFVSNNLRPALNAAGLTATKIISSENAAWGTANSFLSGMDKSNADILAGHGYVEIGDLIFGKRGLNQDPKPWSFATGNKPVWLTETSDDGGTYDGTITGGLKLATSMHKFLAECNINAFVYWLGMLAIKNNESLIGTNSDGSLEFPKTYEVMGQFSRAIHPGYIRFDSKLQNNSTLKISAYKDPVSGKFSLVAINPSQKAVVCKIQLDGFNAGLLNSFQTTDSNIRWQNSAPVAVKANGIFQVLVPASGVITFTGTKG